uniref:Uncharacterized protein n=1 Tax=Calcidiscus leptoporus TaxID=127549 RepID=A0A7S0JIY5_9EUKA|mmetsp:Transcript_6735/g.15652  ORF Transcript_6735/g.15652 Transcript_6735/m.15652 type:complete len:234 (+) Transcript_6735:755-1456(+)
MMVAAWVGEAPDVLRLYAFACIFVAVPWGLLGTCASDGALVHIQLALGIRAFAAICTAILLYATLYVRTPRASCPYGSAVQCGLGFGVSLGMALHDPAVMVGFGTALRRRPEAPPLCASLRATWGWAAKRYGRLAGALTALLLPEVAWAHMESLHGHFAMPAERALARFWLVFRLWYAVYAAVLLVLPPILWAVHGADGADRIIICAKMVQGSLVLSVALLFTEANRRRVHSP